MQGDVATSSGRVRSIRPATVADLPIRSHLGCNPWSFGHLSPNSSFSHDADTRCPRPATSLERSTWRSETRTVYHGASDLRPFVPRIDRPMAVYQASHLPKLARVVSRIRRVKATGLARENSRGPSGLTRGLRWPRRCWALSLHCARHFACGFCVCDSFGFINSPRESMQRFLIHEAPRVAAGCVRSLSPLHLVA